MRGNWIAGFVWDSVLQRVGATWRIACLLFLGDNGQGQAFLLYQETKRLVKCWDGMSGRTGSSSTEDGLRAG